MKAKSKVMLGLAAMLGVSAAVASYSTYAWFITTRIASVKIDSVGAKSNDGSLQLVGITDSCINLPQYKLGTATGTDGVTGSELSFAYTATDNISLTDVSSDGKTFYKPIWNAKTHGNGHSNDTPASSGAAVTNQLSASDIKNVTTGDGDSEDTKESYEAGDEYLTDDNLGYFKQFKFKINNTGTNEMNVYMSKVENTPLVKRDSAKSATENANEIGGFRLSVVIDNKVVFYYAPIHDDNIKHIAATSSEDDKLYDVKKFQLEALDSDVKVSYGQDSTGSSDLTAAQTFSTIVDGGETAAMLANQLIISNLAKDAKKEVTINIWVEGESNYTDTNSMNGVVADFAFNLVALGA